MHFRQTFMTFKMNTAKISTLVFLFAVVGQSESVRRAPPGPPPCPLQPPKVWVFEMPIYPPPLSYLNSSGEFTGLYRELLQAVCEIAEKECDYTTIPVQKCMEAGPNGENIAGEGLMGDWFDGCFGFGITTERQQQVEFSNPFSPLKSNMMVLPSSPLVETQNVTGKIVAFAGGQLSSPQCLINHGVTGFEAIFVNGHAAGMEALESGEADALFNSNNALNTASAELVIINPAGEGTDPDMQCISGTALMTKKGSEAIDWWNEALETYKASGAFLSLCEKYLEIGRQMYFDKIGSYPDGATVHDICLLD
ncbi:uncharacterized protein LOC106154107 [Lingula anatina]|uniref:Uncharacterized protein LOC106154107 n=1 Tax=Lingula anatina TaxID=7574 RepID=A0A1S3HCR1_LINAN|nr:uncharacterized protein LOC106154107 [Lingula anatina]|eukprot:XP_013383813.1 uncharacterized protein LOC106154107 [Lingula anatina]